MSAERSFDSASQREEPAEEEAEHVSTGGDNRLAGARAIALIAAAERIVTGWSAHHGPRRGVASFYGTSRKGDHSGDGFAGRPMANGEPMDPNRLTAAHRTLPLGTRVTVRRVDGSAWTIVTITDRGPYVNGRILDVSPAAARQLGLIEPGHALVELSLADGKTGWRWPVRSV